MMLRMPYTVTVEDAIKANKEGNELLKKHGGVAQVLNAGDKIPGHEKAGFADGIRCDVDGNIWASAGWVGDGYDGVHVFEPKEGVRIGQIRLPEICSNVCFGGTKRNRLFMTGSTSLYAVYVETQGAHIT